MTARVHQSNFSLCLYFISSGNRPSENWQLYSDDDTMKQFARLVQIYKQLSNYTKDQIRVYTQTGAPLQRPLFYRYPLDSDSWNVKYQYTYGNDLIVAPVLKVSALCMKTSHDLRVEFKLSLQRTANIM